MDTEPKSAVPLSNLEYMAYEDMRKMWDHNFDLYKENSFDSWAALTLWRLLKRHRAASLPKRRIRFPKHLKELEETAVRFEKRRQALKEESNQK